MTFQVQLHDSGMIVLADNGMFAGPGQDALGDLDEGILVGLSKSDGTDDGRSDPGGTFSTSSTTIYKLWCYASAVSCDGGRPGPVNSVFDLDQ